MTEPITRQDIEDRFRRIQKDISGEQDKTSPVAVAAGAIGGVVALAIVFGVGRLTDKGRKFVPFRRS